MALSVFSAGEELDSPDHPGFNDQVYRERRKEIAECTNAYYADHPAGDVPLPRIDYTPEEIGCWSTIWDKLLPLQRKHASAEHLALFEEMLSQVDTDRTTIPQLQDINDFCEKRTGFRIRPTPGLLTPRHFLHGLAFRIFYSTQYIRHHSVPFYTPEPDVVHELLGHAPLLADPDFADLCQEIGMASIGATDDQVWEMVRNYWFTAEFGLIKQNGELKIYGAGILSSFGEIEYSMGLGPGECTDYATLKPEYRDYDPEVVAKQEFPITKMQPLYFVSESFADAKSKIKAWHDKMAKKKEFTVCWDTETRSLVTTPDVARETQA